MKVSVAMITYNHERFIAQAIESVLMQETSFDYELAIGEDCSTDRTRELVGDFQRRFPGKIRTILREQNVGMHENFDQTLQACNGTYIALLEGDDYWTSPHKLQRQVDFLDGHPECSLCFHPVKWSYDDPGEVQVGWPEHNSDWPPQLYRDQSTVEDILREMFIQTGSLMFRNHLLDGYPKWFYQLPIGDWPLCILLAEKGKIGCLNEPMSVYRKHAGGIWFAVEDEKRYQAVIQMYECLNVHFDHKYAHIIRPILADYHLKLAVFYDQKGMSERARSSLVKSIAARVMGKERPALNSFKMLARLSLPKIYSLSKKLTKA